MSRARTRARKRRRRLESDLREIIHRISRAESELREAVQQARRADAKAVEANRGMTYPLPGHGALWRLLRDLERFGQRLWPLAMAIHCTEEEMDMLKAMIAQVVAPHLAGMTPGNVLRRHNLPPKPQQHRWA